jgi:hypothetical protein
MQAGNAAIIEQQRRIHELESRAIQEHESRAEETREHTTHAAIPTQDVAYSEPAVQDVQRHEPPPPAPRAVPREERRAEEPRIDAKQLLDDSGLVMVETDRAKVQVQPQVIEEAPQPAGRARRERPKPQDDELVQVETRK